MTSFDPTESTAGNGVPAKKSKARRGSADKLSRPIDESVCSPEQADERQRQMRALIQLGKQQGFLTHAEINDHLPGNFAQTSAIETIVSTFRDMGVAVYEEAPDSETLLLNDLRSRIVVGSASRRGHFSSSHSSLRSRLSTTMCRRPEP